MSQSREPPAYQEYAGAVLSDLRFRMLSLEQRGLLYTLKLECWKNRQLPAGHESLTMILGLSVSEQALTAIMPFFALEGDCIRSPELDNYRDHLEERRQKQIAGGRSGAEITNKKRQKAEDLTRPGKPPGKPRVPRRVANGSLVQSSPAQHNQDQLTGEVEFDEDADLEDLPF